MACTQSRCHGSPCELLKPLRPELLGIVPVLGVPHDGLGVYDHPRLGWHHVCIDLAGLGALSRDQDGSCCVQLEHLLDDQIGVLDVASAHPKINLSDEFLAAERRRDFALQLPHHLWVHQQL